MGNKDSTHRCIGYYSREALKELHTGTLYYHFEAVRRNHDVWARENVLGFDDHEYMRMLKEELATREHIPTVPEAKAARQQKAKEKKNRGRQH